MGPPHSRKDKEHTLLERCLGERAGTRRSLGLVPPQLCPLPWVEVGLAALPGNTSEPHGFCLSGKPLALTIGPVQPFPPSSAMPPLSETALFSLA